LLFHLFNANRTNDIWQTKIQQLSHQNLSSEVDNTIDKLKGYKSSGTGQIQAEVIHSGGKLASSEVQKTDFLWHKEKFLRHFKKSIILPVYRDHKPDLVNNNRGTSQL
jgi:hypothetical protein